MRSRHLHIRSISLVRGNVLVVFALVAAVFLSHAPELRRTAWLVLPLLLAMWGTAETARCLQRRWSWYHGGVLLLLYSDLMIATLIAFFLIYPYFLPTTSR